MVGFVISSIQRDIYCMFCEHKLQHVRLPKETNILQVLQSQPEVESRRTKLPGYPQELGEVQNIKKKFTRHTHLDISLLKLRGEEIQEFSLCQPLRFGATPQPKSSRIAISSRMSKFSLFFSKSPEPLEYPSNLARRNSTPTSQYLRDCAQIRQI